MGADLPEPTKEEQRQIDVFQSADQLYTLSLMGAIADDALQAQVDQLNEKFDDEMLEDIISKFKEMSDGAPLSQDLLSYGEVDDDGSIVFAGSDGQKSSPELEAAQAEFLADYAREIRPYADENGNVPGMTQVSHWGDLSGAGLGPSTNELREDVALINELQTALAEGNTDGSKSD